MADPIESAPTIQKAASFALSGTRAARKFLTGRELVVWSLICLRSPSLFSTNLDLLTGYGIHMPPAMSVHSFLRHQGGNKLIGGLLLAAAPIVAVLEFRGRISSTAAWATRLVPLLLFAWLILTDCAPLINPIQQIR